MCGQVLWGKGYTIFVGDIFSGEARKVEGSGMLVCWEASITGCLLGQVGGTGLPLTMRVENRGGLAQESENNLAAACDSWGSRRRAEQDCSAQFHG